MNLLQLHSTGHTLGEGLDEFGSSFRTFVRYMTVSRLAQKEISFAKLLLLHFVTSQASSRMLPTVRVLTFFKVAYDIIIWKEQFLTPSFFI